MRHHSDLITFVVGFAFVELGLGLAFGIATPIVVFGIFLIIVALA